MKKLIFLMALILLTGLTFGQTIQKGNLLGTHVMTVSLQSGVTMDHFLKFFKSKYIPAFEKNHPGWKVYIVKSIRGDVKDSYGMLMLVKSQKERDKYYNTDGSNSKAGNSADEKLKPVSDEMKKFGTFTTTYTDWLVQ